MNTEHNHSGNTSSTPQARPELAWKGAAIMVAVIVGFYVLREHWEHVLGYLPYLLLLACPLMHLFMHHGHGQGQHESHENSRRK